MFMIDNKREIIPPLHVLYENEQTMNGRDDNE